MRILVTNDDGIAAPGLQALATAALGTGAEVVVIAPCDDVSGCGAAIGPTHLMDPVAFRGVRLPGFDRIVAYSCSGPPALAVVSAGLGLGLRPDLVLAGVNRGLNLGAGVLHSGTVGAALTAANLGIPAIAVSLDAGRSPRWGAAAAVAAALVPWLLESRLPVALNLNVPNRTVEALEGVRAATLSRAGQLGLPAGPAPAFEPDSDAALVRQGYATLTVLHGLREAGRETGDDAAAAARGVLVRHPAGAGAPR